MSQTNEKCNKPGNWKGDCCCNCENQIRLRKHPWNKGFGKGSISEYCGWACMAYLDDEEFRTATFSDTEHGMCELHQRK